MFNSRNVLTFLAVAETGNFAAAAGRLGLTASAVSKAVARLEEELGTRLFRRTTRSVALTPEGERFFDGCRRISRDYNALALEIADSSGAPRGRLRINAPSGSGRKWLVEIIAAFGNSYPDISIELTLDDREVDLAAEGVDVVIRAIPRRAHADSTSIIARRLFTDPVVTCAAPAYLDRMPSPEKPSDLRGHRCLNFRNRRTGRREPWFFLEEGELREYEPDGPFLSEDRDSIALAARQGLGIGQFPRVTVSDALAKGELRELLADFSPPGTPFLIAYLDRHLVSPKIRAFVDFMVRECRRTMPGSV